MDKMVLGGTTNVVLTARPLARHAHLRQGRHPMGRRRRRPAKPDLSPARPRRVPARRGLRALGLAPGDVIAIYMPNIPEAVVAMLAAAKIGGIVMPLFSGLGADAIANRLGIGEAKALITVDGSLRRGRIVSAKATVDEAAALAPALARIVVLRYCGVAVDWNPGRDRWWHELCAGQPEDARPSPWTPSPYLLVFTSGTTGKPKGVVHTHIGFSAKLFIDLWLMLDCKPEDRVLWMSDMGWIIGPLLVDGTTLIGATCVLVEGAPNFPDSDRMWRVAAEQEVTYLGVAPTTIRTFMAQGSEPLASYDLSRIRLVISAGEAWTPDAWMWCFEKMAGGGCRSSIFPAARRCSASSARRCCCR